MLYNSKEGLELSTLKVRYMRNGETIEQEVGQEGKQWWLDFASKWDDTEIIGFVDVAYTVEQLTKFEEIRGLSIATNILNDYVMEGIVGEGLEMLQLKKENQELRSLLADLTETVLLGGA